MNEQYSEKQGTQQENPEGEPSRIKLHFGRHGDAETASIGGRDEARHLTPEGMKKIIDQATTVANPVLAKAIGSPRVRTQMTAALNMDGASENFEVGAPSTVLSSIKKGILGAPRVVSDKRLDMQEHSPMADLLSQAYFGKLDKKLLKFTVEDSDRIANDPADPKEGPTYSRMAADMAAIVKEYCEVSERWGEIVKAEKTRTFPKKIQPDLERFPNSHQGIPECFLAKVIEKTRGIEKRDAFVAALQDAGFATNEGFDVEIVNNRGKIAIEIEYSKYGSDGKLLFDFSESIQPEKLDEIIAESSR